MTQQDDPELLALYYREMGRSSMLERERETEMARELVSSREGLRQALRRLPPRCRTPGLPPAHPAPRRPAIRLGGRETAAD